jgi:hypothetical protein
MADLDREIAAYDKMRPELEHKYRRRWVLIHDEALIAVYDTSAAAAQDATRRFGRGPYLIREVGAERPILPASVLYQPHAAG